MTLTACSPTPNEGHAEDGNAESDEDTGSAEEGTSDAADLSSGASEESGTSTEPESSGATEADAGSSAEMASDGSSEAEGSETGGSTSQESESTAAGEVVEIDDLSIEPNPNSVLSVFVTWTTPEPSTSVVQFGEGDDLVWETEGDGDVTEHRVLVIGMHADTTYRIRALSVGASQTFAGDGTYATASLPAQIPVGMITAHDPAEAQPGWTLMNVQKGDGTNRALSGAPPAAVIYDEEGLPVWYFIHGDQIERGGAISVDPTDRGVLMGPTNVTPPVEVDWSGEVLWTCDDVLCGGNFGLSHHAGKLSNGNYIVMRDAQSGGRISQVFEELTPSNELVHTIGVEDAVTPPGTSTGDWAHGNAITVDLENDVAYMSFRWLGVIKMAYSTRTMLWHLPASYGAQGMGNMEFLPPESQYTDIHDPEIHTDGTILFFDNGGFTMEIEDGNPANLHTRAVEYLIDEEALTATLVWEFPGDYETDAWYREELYVPFWGDADRLDNGNVLIAAGRRGVADITPESRIIEVTKDTGSVVWEMLLPKDHGVYRAERLSSPPLLRRIDP